MYTAVVIGGIVLIVALVGVAMWCCYRAGWDNGYEQANGDRHEARHAKPRKSPVEAPEPAAEPSEDNDWYQPLPGPIQSHTSALSLATPVILPEPGEYKPQPARTTAPGTVTFPRVELADDLTDTGALRAIQAIGEASRAALHAGTD